MSSEYSKKSVKEKVPSPPIYKLLRISSYLNHKNLPKKVPTTNFALLLYRSSAFCKIFSRAVMRDFARYSRAVKSLLSYASCAALFNSRERTFSF